MTSRKCSRSTVIDNTKVTSSTALLKEWDRISCPICMEHPHNAVLLICSSYEKGCRCYICNTSYRHSNCLDRFRKMNGDGKLCCPPSTSLVLLNSGDQSLHRRTRDGMIPGSSSRSQRLQRHSAEPREADSDNGRDGPNQVGFSRTRGESNNHQESRRSSLALGGTGECSDAAQKANGLKCPLCRGMVSDWIPAEEARQYLNQKLRTCSHDSCKFVGDYKKLREHARSVHAVMRPAEVDPLRQQAWRRLEHEQEHGDILSAIRSEVPGAIVVGDYAIDVGGGMISPDRESSWYPENRGDLWPPYSISRLMRSSRRSSDDRRNSLSVWPDGRRSRYRNLQYGDISGRRHGGASGGHLRESLDDILAARRRRRRLRY